MSILDEALTSLDNAIDERMAKFRELESLLAERDAEIGRLKAMAKELLFQIDISGALLHSSRCGCNTCAAIDEIRAALTSETSNP